MVLAEAMNEADFEALKKKVWKFMHEYIYPNEQLFAEQNKAMEHLPADQWTYAPILKELMAVAKKQGLWNLWLPNDTARLAGEGYEGAGLNNAQYAEICEIIGTSCHIEFAAECTNSSSPDTGNMETIARYGNEAQKKKWLKPLLDGDIKSSFAMTEPNVASSDASNVGINIEKRGGQYIINGRKWWITGSGSKHCKIYIVMGKTDPTASPFRQQSMILVPADTPGITVVRPMQTFGDSDAPKGHMELLFEDVCVPVENVLAKEGMGFEISQGRLGPGRIHHCMRLIGSAERAIAAMCNRAESRVAFGKKLSEFDTVLQDIAQCRAELDMARMLVRHTAHLLDVQGNLKIRKELSMCKAVVPSVVQRICDRAMQVHGAMGLSQDSFLPSAFSWARGLRLADGPDEVHWRTVGRLELRDQKRKDDSLYDLPGYTRRGAPHSKNPPTDPDFLAKL